jgi:hypothetical protein
MVPYVGRTFRSGMVPYVGRTFRSGESAPTYGSNKLVM